MLRAEGSLSARFSCLMAVKSVLEYLNPAQREAVQNTEGPTLVVAGAGSGKTRVLTYRIAYLMSECGVSPHNILAVTFTNKAANQMRERIVALVGPESRKIWAGTFHSICSRILRAHGDSIGLSRDFTIFDTGDQSAVINECVEQMGLPEKKYQPRPVLSVISSAKEKLVSPDEFPSKFQGEFERVVGRIYKQYEKKLRENNALDFDDLIFWTVRLLKEHPDILKHYQDRFRYIMVDEYQDINISQYTFIKMIADGHRNICCVGDDDQSIYRWRGADVGLILQFEIDYPDAKIFKLEQNYRSTKTILEAAHEVVSRNISRRDKELWTENAHGRTIDVYEAANEQEEAIHIANAILNKVTADGRRFSDFVVLYRMNAQSRVFEDVFLSYRVPYVLVGALRFYERKEIKDVLSYLRLASNPYESISLKRIINSPPRGIGPSTLARIEQFAVDNDIPLWDTIKRIGEIPDIQKKANREIKAFISLIEFLHAKRDEYPVKRLVEEALENSGYLTHMLADKSMDAQSRIENVKEFVSVTEEFDKVADDKSLRGFLEQVALISDIDTYEESGNAVTLMTMHSAKGLEYPVVFIVGMEDGLFPHQRSMDDHDELEEERRLCYVGMTRAKEELHLSHAHLRTFMGQTQRRAKSRFLREVPEHLLSKKQVKAPTQWKSNIEPKRTSVASTYRPGQKVLHEQFGLGIVLNSTGSGNEEQVTIAFDGHGLKKLAVSYAKLEKVG
jgi:DNA helicase-2/ATP-dependent DNA helicase PcrA